MSSNGSSGRVYSLDNFPGGWIVGNFTPVLEHSKSLEVAIKHFTQGQTEPLHFQQIATEYTAVVTGRCRIGDEVIGPGQIFELGPGEVSDFEALSDVVLVAIKTPSIPSDKVMGLPTDG